MPAAKVDFWFEFGSTYTYPAVARIGALAQDRGVSLRWRPFLLGPIFADQGWNDSPFNLYPSKGRYMWRDLERICETQGIPWQRPSVFPRNGLLAARVCLAAEPCEWQPDLVRALFTANFAEDREIGDPEVVSDLLSGMGQDAAKWLKRAASPHVKRLLREQTESAQNLGIFGAPSFTTDGELFWGNDRLEAAFDHAILLG